MHVGFNGRAMAKSNPSGVSRYTRNLLGKLAEHADSGDADLSLSVFGVSELPSDLAGADRIRNAGVPAPAPSGPRAHLWEQSRLPIAIANRDLDVFHTPAGQPPVAARVPQVTTVHDVSPVTHPEWFSTGYSTLVRILTPVAVRRSDRIITVSQFAREELVETYPDATGDVEVVYNGVTEPPVPDDDGAVEGLDPGYLLYVGSTNPRKNLDGLLAAYREYRRCEESPPKLVLVGPDRDIFGDPEYPNPDGVRSLGYVSEETLGWLYRNAAAFAFPSQYEGFGLPILEAMSVGTPVLTDEHGATGEIAGDAAVTVDADYRHSLVAGIETVLDDEGTLEATGRNRAAEFTWDRTATQTLAVYRDVAEA